MRLIHTTSETQETTVLFKNDTPIELCVERKDELTTNTVCLARAVKAIKGAWFVEIGNGVSAFLPTPAVYCTPEGTISSAPLNEGDALFIQIQRPAFEDKEIKASTQISLAADLIVYTPTKEGISFSRQFSDETRNDLEEYLAKAKLSPTDSFTIRTVAKDTPPENILYALQEQRKLWLNILLTAKELMSQKKQGVVFMPPKAVIQLAKQYASRLTEVVTDDSETAALLKKIVPETHFSTQKLGENADVLAAIEEALDTDARLPSGGTLITEQTSACVCFDVNSGPSDWITANTEACTEILRQIRLKGLSGQMIVDFAGRKEKGTIRLLAEKIQAGNRSLRVWGVTNLGLVEITTERTRHSIWEIYDTL